MRNYPLYDVKHIDDFLQFINQIEKYGDIVAFKERECEWSYISFCDDVKAVASYLLKYNRKYILLCLKNSRLFAIAYFAVVLSGNIAVLSGRDLMNLEDIDFLCIDDNCIGDMLKSGKVPIPKTSELDVCTIACSSGTTSYKKGVMLSQKNLVHDTIAGMELYKYERGAVYVNFLPYSHLFGIVADLMGPLYSGGTICVVRDKLHFFEDLTLYKPTNLNLPPVLVKTMCIMLKRTNNFEKATGGRLKKIMCAGARLDESYNEVLVNYGCRAYSAYGLTECSPCVTMSRDEYYKNGSVGLVLPCCNVEIVDGEVVVSGSTIMIGYYNDEEATKSVLIDGKLYTGDMGYIDEDGFLFLTGRKSNLIVFEDGNKVVPELLEEKINNIEGVKESLVESVFIGSKVRILIKLVNDQVFDINKLNELLVSEGVVSYVKEICMEKELEKNELGKIIRRKKL